MPGRGEVGLYIDRCITFNGVKARGVYFTETRRANELTLFARIRMLQSYKLRRNKYRYSLLVVHYKSSPINYP